MKIFSFSVLLSAAIIMFSACGGTTSTSEIHITPEMNIAPRNSSITLVCDTAKKSGSIKYQWYETPDGSTAKGTAVAEATDRTFNTPVFSEKGIYYYYCTADTGNSGTENSLLVSNVASVAYTALPVLYIDTPGGTEIKSKDDWLENITVSLAGASNKKWNFENIPASIRGRGNSTWENPKKPYAVKFDSKQEITGLQEHKRWVLLANYLDNSFIHNDTAFYLSRIFEMDWTPGGNFVDLVINGEYKGLYWFGEDVRVHKNRVNINDGDDDITDDKDKDYLIEIDKYYDETVKFRSRVRDLPYMIKNDDYMTDENGEISSGGQARLERLQEKINKLENLLYPGCKAGDNTHECPDPDESCLGTIDADSWIKYWFVNEIMGNMEILHPKSSYFTFDSAKNTLKAGPVWDFDLSMIKHHSSCILKKAIYYDALFKSPLFKARVKELWEKYYGEINVDSHIEVMRSKLAVAALYDTMLWGERDDPSGVNRENFDAYVDFFKESVMEKLSVVDANISSIK